MDAILNRLRRFDRGDVLAGVSRGTRHARPNVLDRECHVRDMAAYDARTLDLAEPAPLPQVCRDEWLRRGLWA